MNGSKSKKDQRIKFMLLLDNEYFADEVGTLKLEQVVKKICNRNRRCRLP